MSNKISQNYIVTYKIKRAIIGYMNIIKSIKGDGINMKNKIIAILLVSSICCALSACGGNTDTETSAVETETSTVESEAVSETEETEEVESETQTESEYETETVTEAESEYETETATEAKSESNVADVKKTDTKTETTKVAEEKQAHTHSWDGGTVTQAATCTANGVITYKCSCGETKTEAINAVGHSWVAQTTTVHHDAEGMYQQVKTGTVKVVICDCGQKFYDNETFQAHSWATLDSGTITTEPTYETKWVETSPAWDEPVTTGYICSVCGTAQ
jgi:hypothetical protein